MIYLTEMKQTYTNWYRTNMFATEALAFETKQAELILQESHTIAIVGLSRNRHNDSQYVARYLKNAGYKIIPVNPGADEILGEPAYPDLASIPVPVDIIDLFLHTVLILDYVKSAIPLSPKGIWLQLGTGKQPDALTLASKSSITIFENRCIKVDHQFLIRPKLESLITSTNHK